MVSDKSYAQVFESTIEASSRKASEQAMLALAKSAGLSPAEREAYLRSILVDIAEAGGDVAALTATEYVRAVAADDPALQGLDDRPRPTDREYLSQSVDVALQTQTGGLHDADRVREIRHRVALVVESHVRKAAFRHVNRLAKGLGRRSQIVAEPGACGFCLGRAKPHHRALPPYHRRCRCSVELVSVTE